MVCGCHSIRQQVIRLMLTFAIAIAIAIMTSQSSSGRSTAMFPFLGFSNTPLMPRKGLAKISLEFTP